MINVDDFNSLGWYARGRYCWIGNKDLESNGCTFSYNSKDPSNEDWQLYYNNKEHIEIFDLIMDRCVFVGSFDNKEELKVLMKQLNIAI